MSRAAVPALIVIFGATGLAGCASAPGQTAGAYASNGAHATYHAVYATGGDMYAGVGTAAKKPFRDLNMMQDPIPPVLVRAEVRPYDVAGLESCDAILNKVAQLDLALGPDLDSPKDLKTDRTARAATLAAAAAIDAASSAAEGFLPMRSVIRQVTGANSYDEHVKHALLAGTERRAFLKAVGMQHNCSWPAAPLGFQPVVVAIATSPLAVPTLPATTVLYARGGMITAHEAAVAYLTPAAPIRVASVSPRAARARRSSFGPPAPVPPAGSGPATIASTATYVGGQGVRVPVSGSVPIQQVAVTARSPTAEVRAVPAATVQDEPGGFVPPVAKSPTEAQNAAYAVPIPALVGGPATSPSAAFAAPWSGSAPGR